jgi:hypothetical protein
MLLEGLQLVEFTTETDTEWAFGWKLADELPCRADVFTGNGTIGNQSSPPVQHALFG